MVKYIHCSFHCCIPEVFHTLLYTSPSVLFGRVKGSHPSTILTRLSLCSKDFQSSPLTNGTSTLEYSTTRSVTSTPHSTPQHQSAQDTYNHSPKSPAFNGSASPTVYYGNSRRSSVHSNSEPPQEVSPAHVKFVRDTSKFWYKPTISREEGKIGFVVDFSDKRYFLKYSKVLLLEYY